MTYDTFSRLLTEEQIWSGQSARTTQHQYDSIGNRTKLIYPTNPSTSYLDFVPDAVNRITQIKNPSAQIIAGYSYVGYRVEERTYLNNTKLTAHYDGLKRVTEILHQNTSTSQIVNQLMYGYDKENNRLFEKRVLDSAGDLFRYDSDYRLTKAQYEVPSSQIDAYLQNGTEPTTVATQTDYNLDGVGNRNSIVKDSVTTNYTINSLNQYSYVNSTNYVYDNNGNLKDDGTNLYAYDYANRLMEVKRKSDSVVIATYYYDAFGRRFEKVTSSGTVYYYYSGAQIVEEYNSSSLQAKFVYGLGIDEVLTMERGGHTYYYHTNILGSVMEITDENGNIVEHYKYDAYGKVTIYDSNHQVIASSAIGNIYYYTGRQLDTESGLYYYRARYYSADLGRFLSRDPIGYFDSLNLYAYVNNNPINYLDPLGFNTKQGPFDETEDVKQYKTWLNDVVRGTDNLITNVFKTVTKIRDDIKLVVEMINVTFNPESRGLRKKDKKYKGLAFDIVNMGLSKRLYDFIDVGMGISGIANAENSLARQYWSHKEIFKGSDLFDLKSVTSKQGGLKFSFEANPSFSTGDFTISPYLGTTTTFGLGCDATVGASAKWNLTKDFYLFGESSLIYRDYKAPLDIQESGPAWQLGIGLFGFELGYVKDLYGTGQLHGFLTVPTYQWKTSESGYIISIDLFSGLEDLLYTLKGQK